MGHVGGAGKALQSQVEFGVAFVVGGGVAKFIGLLVIGAVGVVKAVVRVAAKAGVSGAEREHAFDPAVLRGGAKQVLHVDRRFQVFGFDPTFWRFRAQASHHLGAVWHELLHFHAGAAQKQRRHIGCAGRAAAGQIQVDAVTAGGRAV